MFFIDGPFSWRALSSTTLFACVVACSVASCSGNTNDTGADNGVGGLSNAGASNMGGNTQTSTNIGGNTQSGGSSSVAPITGGAAAGGAATGGAATGGKSSTGVTATGGSATGGKSSTGGAATGGAAAGGAATGGKSSTSVVATGGLATGGTSSSAGTAAGGNAAGGAATGGAATGGRLNTGGAATGGAATGGAATGGKSATGGSSAVATSIGGTHSGQATYYDYNDNGHCSFTNTYDAQDFAALNSSDYGSATWCGACAKVTGPKGTVDQVIIVDECPSCAAGDLDLKPATFDKIADHSAGRVQITWNFVPCNVTGPIQYHYKDGSSEGWTSVLVINSRLPVSKMEYSTDGGSTWKPMTRQTYNYFEVASGFGGPAMIRLTSSTGATLTESLPSPTSNTTITGTKNF